MIIMFYISKIGFEFLIIMKRIFTEGYDRTISIHDVYKIRSDSSEVYITEYGKWNVISGLSIDQESIWKRRSDFKGHNIR